MVLTKTHGIDMDHGIDKTHCIDLDLCYRIGTPVSHTHERAEFCPYAGFFLEGFNYFGI